ncbi:hypothetical protein GMST_10660 [Geomonas silvestris]|uniref:Uncharacterized protein n=1 Tax=Geomonas silvestris TaxID=2740184 RepID=A0A6V8MFH3_9BACT|nr:hypothetical protein GMST_10660 [Geomonas silvestris]
MRGLGPVDRPPVQDQKLLREIQESGPVRGVADADQKVDLLAPQAIHPLLPGPRPVLHLPPLLFRDAVEHLHEEALGGTVRRRVDERLVVEDRGADQPLGLRLLRYGQGQAQDQQHQVSGKSH